MSIESFREHHPKLAGAFATVAGIGIAVGTSLAGVFAARAAGCGLNVSGAIELASMAAGSYLGGIAAYRIID